LINESIVAINRIGQQFMRDRNSWRPTFAENIIPNRTAVRRTRWGVDLVFRDDSVLLAPGSINNLTKVDITDPGGETVHQLMDVTRTPMTPAVERRAIAWNGRPGAERRAGTRNGNALHPDVKPIFAPLLPGKILSPINGMMPQVSGAVAGPVNQTATVNPNSGSASQKENK
jgi:hypothetical protein